MSDNLRQFKIKQNISFNGRVFLAGTICTENTQIPTKNVDHLLADGLIAEYDEMEDTDILPVPETSTLAPKSPAPVKKPVKATWDKEALEDKSLDELKGLLIDAAISDGDKQCALDVANDPNTTEDDLIALLSE